MDEEWFSFEKLEVWQEVVAFAEKCLAMIDRLEARGYRSRILGQLEAAVVSIAANIAEGKGRFSKKEFAQFLYIARGSLFEAVTIVEILTRRGWICRDEQQELKRDAARLGKRISTLISTVKRSAGEA
jgi:four helix bundle protein